MATLLGISGRHHAVAVTRRRRGETFLSTPRSRKEFASESWTKFLVLCISLSLSLSPLCWPTCLHDPFVANRGVHHTSDQTTGSLQVKEIVGVGAVFPRHASLNAGGGARGVACSVRQTDANDSHSTQHFLQSLILHFVSARNLHGI